MNKKLTAKERGLLKGSIRRVFARSELRIKVLKSARIDHFDPKRPRVKKWSRCSECKEPTAEYQLQVDHVLPVIPLDRSFEEMSLDEVVDRTWTDENNLQPLCTKCHSYKTKSEIAERKKNKKGKKNV